MSCTDLQPGNHDDHGDHEEIGGCTLGSWRLSDQMRIAASIAQIGNHESLTQLLTTVGIELLGHTLYL